MSRTPSLQSLEDEERAARNRLAVYRARIYSAPPGSPANAQRRLAELERRWTGAAQRLRRARQRAC